ncbi:hypothetical protein H5410_058438 [Solanum commersonii]|uniref:F-box associated domain-containing protein n=1 Tax=Solanum commersonii TaxID=4109 RepID=A0A9J5WTI4_SOLCO|nr:hypothetical protein H5410_058438 [Solanum commersonii]
MQWCSIIYSGSFAYSHVECGILKSSSSSFSQLEAVVIEMTNDGRSITVSALEWHSSSDENWETKFMYTLDDVFDHPRIMITVNSVNGFVCFWSSDARLHVCNHLTEEYFTTPSYTYENNIFVPLRLAAVGFGFCQLSYEYMVIVLHEYIDAGFEYVETKPLVFTVGTDRSWRSLKAIRDRRFHSRHEKDASVKGVIY